MRPQSPKTEEALTASLAAFIRDLSRDVALDTCRNCKHRMSAHGPPDLKCLFGPGTFEPTILEE
jgi:hypothetical protein